ncbi:MAG: polymer-forming cytoskeletal protein [Rhodospirillaceae bacterium]|nr:polymer-forming cytoskeletal protein [Rhodospirillaceae bacterium]MDD9999199.1 polymer-forming cytoskeletal protein [Rhodospirillaceae bacterium]
MGATVTIKGDVTGEGDVFISGTIKGTIDLAENLVTIEGTGRVKGRIVGKRVQVGGKVVGDIEAMEKIAISSSGSVQGTIVAPRIAVEDGAKFKGRIDMELDEGREAPAAAALSKK